MKNHSLLRSLLWAAPAASAYLILMPLAANDLDRRLGLVGILPCWTRTVSLVLIPPGATLALWCTWLFAIKGEGTPNPMFPPKLMVVEGPYRYSRNPMMLGAWLVGIGLAFALRSVTLLIAIFCLAIVGCLYVRQVEEPKLLLRFGEAYRNYKNSVTRWVWICSLLFVLFLPLSSVAQSGKENTRGSQAGPVPTVIVQIKLKPVVGNQWVEAFEKEIVPAIQEAIDNRDEITGYAYFENVVAGQPYDFVLIMQAKSFSFFDRRQYYPHYRALFRRLGPEKAGKLLADMDGWEEEVRVTLVRGYGSLK